MECKYCGLCSLTALEMSDGVHFCDADCFYTYARENTKTILEKRVESHSKSIASVKKLGYADEYQKQICGVNECVKAVQIEYLLYKALLKRQTKEQLSLLHTQLIEQQRAFFLKVDEHRQHHTDGFLLMICQFCKRSIIHIRS